MHKCEKCLKYQVHAPILNVEMSNAEMPNVISTNAQMLNAQKFNAQTPQDKRDVQTLDRFGDCGYHRLVRHKQKAKLEMQSLCIDQTALCRHIPQMQCTA